MLAGVAAAAKALLTMMPALDPHAAFGSHRRRGRDRFMEGKARIIFPILATGLVVFIVSCVVTCANIGFRPDFVRRWMSAFLIGWPVAAVTGLIAFPQVRRLTLFVVAMIERSPAGRA